MKTKKISTKDKITVIKLAHFRCPCCDWDLTAHDIVSSINKPIFVGKDSRTSFTNGDYYPICLRCLIKYEPYLVSKLDKSITREIGIKINILQNDLYSRVKEFKRRSKLSEDLWK